ncbi:MAG: DISARM system phospholipase D-like protein DrmC [Candidatus Eisenbacteria sp.]|nr:DISARM system phospholipase D-like protein DrmC [Candidatus Eisenbacteria bacterium]
MTDALLTLPAHLRRRLVQALESGLLAMPCSEVALRSALGLREGGEAVVAALGELEELGVAGPAAAAWIRALEDAASRAPRPDLVWSGPEVPGLHARDTRRVYEELLGSAERSVWVSTYAYFDGPRAFEVLARRMDAVPDLHVTLLLNIQRKRGDTTTGEELVRRFADRLWGTDWPGTSRPRVFYDPRSVELDGPTGVLHAKAVVADEEAVFVTSANLTEAALDRNIEVGILVRDRALAASMTTHFCGLIDQGLLRPLPRI